MVERRLHMQEVRGSNPVPGCRTFLLLSDASKSDKKSGHREISCSISNLNDMFTTLIETITIKCYDSAECVYIITKVSVL